jgi:uncharacterized membrane protein YtjA (UPF0391 family)
MLWAAILFLILAIVSGALGFGLIAGTAYVAAKVLFFVFIVLFVLSLISGAARQPLP